MAVGIIPLAVDLKPFKQHLRRMGFTFEGRIRSRVNHQVHTYTKEYPEIPKKLDLQLWGDGHHRVSHWHPNKNVPKEHRSLYGQMNTLPTDFTTVQEMLEAIQRELAR